MQNDDPHPKERAWIDRFVKRLGQCLPYMTPTDALAVANESLPRAGNVEPEEAAEACALAFAADLAFDAASSEDSDAVHYKLV